MSYMNPWEENPADRDLASLIICISVVFIGLIIYHSMPKEEPDVPPLPIHQPLDPETNPAAPPLLPRKGEINEL